MTESSSHLRFNLSPRSNTYAWFIFKFNFILQKKKKFFNRRKGWWSRKQNNTYFKLPSQCGALQIYTDYGGSVLHHKAVTRRRCGGASASHHQAVARWSAPPRVTFSMYFYFLTQLFSFLTTIRFSLNTSEHWVSHWLRDRGSSSNQMWYVLVTNYFVFHQIIAQSWFWTFLAYSKQQLPI